MRVVPQQETDDDPREIAAWDVQASQTHFEVGARESLVQVSRNRSQRVLTGHTEHYSDDGRFISNIMFFRVMHPFILLFSSSFYVGNIINELKHGLGRFCSSGQPTWCYEGQWIEDKRQG
jgi:hypothetical protein